MKCRNSRGDGGRSSGAALQGEASNNPELLRSRAVVVSVRGKGVGKDVMYGTARRAQANHCRSVEKLNGGIKTGPCTEVRDESSGSLLTGWVVSGVEVA